MQEREIRAAAEIPDVRKPIYVVWSPSNAINFQNRYQRGDNPECTVKGRLRRSARLDCLDLADKRRDYLDLVVIH